MHCAWPAMRRRRGPLERTRIFISTFEVSGCDTTTPFAIWLVDVSHLLLSRWQSHTVLKRSQHRRGWESLDLRWSCLWDRKFGSDANRHLVLRHVHMQLGYIAQWLERLTADQQVPGSNPGVPSCDLAFGDRRRRSWQANVRRTRHRFDLERCLMENAYIVLKKIARDAFGWKFSSKPEKAELSANLNLIRGNSLCFAGVYV
jgi:hypothetical protein